MNPSLVALTHYFSYKKSFVPHLCHNTHIKMFHVSSSVFSVAPPEEEFTERMAQPHAPYGIILF